MQRKRAVTSLSSEIGRLHMSLAILLSTCFLFILSIVNGSIIYAPESLQKNKNVGLVVAGVIGGGAVLLSAICIPFVTPALRKVCLPYVPATTTQVSNVMKALEGRKGKLIDLGSGDGRIVLEAARRGFVANGVELNPWLVLFSKIQALRGGFKNAAFSRKDIWKTELREYDNVVIFGVDSMMKDLESKCDKEMPSQSVIVACRFPFPSRVPNRVVGEGIDAVWLYDNSATPILGNELVGNHFENSLRDNANSKHSGS